MEKNLSYLLDFVYTPYFTDVNVEKEKGIIKEEILMYDDDPEWVLDDTMRKNLFYHLPIREKIAGTVESIMKISVSDLKQAYDAFYHPSNMFLVIGGNFKPECLEKLIKSHKRLNEFKGLKNIQRIYYDEPDDVCCEFKKLNMDIEIPKIRFSIKINKNRFSSFDDIELSMYFGILMTVLFGQTSDFKEKVINEQLTTGFYVEKNKFDDFITIDITAESDKADMFIDEVKNTLEDFSITKKDLERIKKVWIASEIRMIDNIEMTVDNICSDLILYDRVYTNRIEKIKKLNSRKLEKFIDELDLSNQSLVMILPKK